MTNFSFPLVLASDSGIAIINDLHVFFPFFKLLFFLLDLGYHYWILALALDIRLHKQK